MNPTVPRVGKRCAYIRCRRWFRRTASGNFQRAKYCDRACAAAARPRASRVAAGKKGGVASGIKRRGESREAIRQRLEGKTVDEGFLLGRKYGKADMANQRLTARREGFADGFEKGYEAAMKDSRLERSA